jgi:hypothetical protein
MYASSHAPGHGRLKDTSHNETSLERIDEEEFDQLNNKLRES